MRLAADSAPPNRITVQMYYLMKQMDLDDVVNENGRYFVNAEQLASIIRMTRSQQCSSYAGKHAMEAMMLGDSRLADEVIKANGWLQSVDNNEVEVRCRQLLSENPKLIEQILGSDAKWKKRRINGVIGKIMKGSNGQCNPVLVKKCIDEILAEHSSRMDEKLTDESAPSKEEK